jgi:hypothetical protein
VGKNLTLGVADPAIPLLNLPKIILKPEHQKYHATVWGKTGKGKSTLLHNVFVEGIMQGKTIGLIDPHKDLSHDILKTLLARGFFKKGAGYKKLVYIEWGNGSYAPYNFLNSDRPADDIGGKAFDAMTRVWPELEQAPFFRRLFENSMLVLIANNLPITYLQRLLTRDDFRAECLKKVHAPSALDTFYEFDNYRQSDRGDKAGSTLNRAHAFTYHHLPRWIFGQPDNVIHFRKWMDEGTSFIMNLGGINIDEVRNLLGAMMMTHIEEAALSRTDIDEEDRNEVIGMVDEWQMFSRRGKSFKSLLSQARKYKFRLWLSSQSLYGVDFEALRKKLFPKTVSEWFRKIVEQFLNEN